VGEIRRQRRVATALYTSCSPVRDSNLHIDRSSTLSNSLDGRKEGSSPSVALVRLIVDLQAAASPEGRDKQHGGQDSREYGHHDCHSENVFADHA